MESPHLGSTIFPESQPSPIDHLSSYPSLFGWDSSYQSPIGRDSLHPSFVGWDLLQPCLVGRNSSEPSLISRDSSQRCPIHRDSSQPSPIGIDSSQPYRSVHSTSHLDSRNNVKKIRVKDKKVLNLIGEERIVVKFDVYDESFGESRSLLLRFCEILACLSVSRVLREDGFYSTQVKNNVVSLEIFSQNSKEIDHNKRPHKKVSPVCVKNEDVMSVVESLMNKNRKNIVLVSESIDNLEGLIKGVINKVENKDVPDDLKKIKFISLALLSFGDLKWVADYRANYGERRIISYYCSVEHMIMEIGRSVCSFCENEKFLLVGIATFQSYMRCKSVNNSLESIWVCILLLCLVEVWATVSTMTDLDLNNHVTTRARQSMEEPPGMELKALPSNLRYAFMGANNTLLVIIVADVVKWKVIMTRFMSYDGTYFIRQ
ncbi:hypothetical protein BC332_13472 [Capsicum chinense]|nr:hypothetical protein BC332_13472 [Capsicum chinense]